MSSCSYVSRKRRKHEGDRKNSHKIFQTPRNFCLTGKSPVGLSSPVCKNISSSQPTQITGLSHAVPSHLEGRLAIVTDAGRDAVDADVPMTNGTDADGEGAWF
jgi:hypothetical protein